MFGSSRPPFAALDEAGAEVLWRGHQSVPGYDDLAKATASLPVAGARLRPKGDGLVLRGARHLLAWAQAYLTTEDEILHADFISESKSFECLLLRSQDMSEVNVVFRLNTAGLEGWTQYRIAWRRVDDDDFSCFE